MGTLVGCCKTCGITVEDVDGNDTKSIDFASYNPKCGLCRIEPFDPILVMTHKKTTITAVYRNKDGKIDKTKTLQAYDDGAEGERTVYGSVNHEAHGNRTKLVFHNA